MPQQEQLIPFQPNNPFLQARDTNVIDSIDNLKRAKLLIEEGKI